MNGEQLFEPVPAGLDPDSPEYVEWAKSQFRRIGFVDVPGDQARMLIAETE